MKFKNISGKVKRVVKQGIRHKIQPEEIVTLSQVDINHAPGSMRFFEEVGENTPVVKKKQPVKVKKAEGTNSEEQPEGTNPEERPEGTGPDKKEDYKEPVKKDELKNDVNNTPESGHGKPDKKDDKESEKKEDKKDNGPKKDDKNTIK